MYGDYETCVSIEGRGFAVAASYINNSTYHVRNAVEKFSGVKLGDLLKVDGYYYEYCGSFSDDTVILRMTESEKQRIMEYTD